MKMAETRQDVGHLVMLTMMGNERRGDIQLVLQLSESLYCYNLAEKPGVIPVTVFLLGRYHHRITGLTV
jgi:hypothetical protein